MSTTLDTRPPKNTSGKTNAQNVRPNQRKPFRKATNKEVQDRTEWVALKIALSPQIKEGALKALIKERFNLKYQRALQYITRAKELLQERANISRETAKHVAVNALLDQIQNEGGSSRTAAIRLWTDVFGLQAPQRTTLEGIEGAAPIKIETKDTTPVPRLTHARLQELIALRNSQPIQNGHTNGNGNGHTEANGSRAEGA